MGGKRLKKSANFDAIKPEHEVKKESDIIKEKMKKFFVASFCMAFAAYLIYKDVQILQVSVDLIAVCITGYLAIVFFVAAVSCLFDLEESKKLEKLAEEARIEEKEFSQIDPEKRDLRAEKMFRMNQKELMRYYDMNLAQTKFLSGLGIMMIIFGILIVVITLYMYMAIGTDEVVLVVGSLSGIVVDFIGAVFIKMYTKNIEAAVKFHAKFAESNNLLLANSIANKIEDDRLRETTLSEMSKNIVLQKNQNK